MAEFAAPPSRVWQVWSDPQQLERWWGPPTWPATEPSVLEFEDGFSDESGTPNPGMPTELVTMGMVEGFTAAMNQIDDML